MPRAELIYVTSGDAYLQDRRLVFTVTDNDEATLDLSGLDLTFLVKARRSDADVDALITKSTPTEIEIAAPQTGATKGVCYVALEEADTEDLHGKFYWELEAQDVIGKVTLGTGKLYVQLDLVVGV